MLPEQALFNYLHSKKGKWLLSDECDGLKSLWFMVTDVAISLDPVKDDEWNYNSLINFSVRLRAEKWAIKNLEGEDVCFIPEYTIRQLSEKFFHLPSTCGVTCLIESKRGKLLWPDDKYLLREPYWIKSFVKKYLEQR